MPARGNETIFEVVDVQRNSDGDPVDGAPPPERPIKNCQFIPRTHPDDKTLIIDGWQVFIPPTSTPPEPESQIRARGELWSIDGGISPFDKGGVPKGAIVTLERVRLP